MSRIGRMPITKPANVEVKCEEKEGMLTINVKGPKGQLQKTIPAKVDIKVDDMITVSIKEGISSKDKFARAMWGTTRALLNNMIKGVTEGFKKSLEVVGLGYRAEMKGNKLVLTVGYSHPVEIEVPKSLKVSVERQANFVVHVEGIDKEEVGHFAAKIRAVRKPEPYKGAGIRYLGEQIRRKQGKRGA